MSERRLYIGAPVNCDGWEVYDNVSHQHVDHVGSYTAMVLQAGDYSIVYVTCLPKLDFRMEALSAMSEWYRILRAGGVLILPVLDLAVLAELKQMPPENQLGVLGHIQEISRFWTEEILGYFLQLAGFVKVRKQEVALFNDSSAILVNGKKLYSTYVAEKVA